MSTAIIPDPYSSHSPHRDLGTQYALRALRERRAFMIGELEKLDRRKRYLEEAIVHLDATLAMLAPDLDPTLVKARFPRRKSKLFGAGKLNALILGVLRKAERPMTQREVVMGVRVDAGFEEEAEAARAGEPASSDEGEGFALQQGDGGHGHMGVIRLSPLFSMTAEAVRRNVVSLPRQSVCVRPSPF